MFYNCFLFFCVVVFFVLAFKIGKMVLTVCGKVQKKFDFMLTLTKPTVLMVQTAKLKYDDKAGG